MNTNEEDYQLALRITRALHEKDGDELVASVVRFMKHNELRASSCIVAEIPRKCVQDA